MDFGALAVVLAAGLLGPALASAPRWGPPVVCGQIVAGVVIGPGGLGWVEPTDTVLSAVAAIGFVLLMFIVGTHLPLHDREVRRAVAAGGAIAATVGVIAAVAGVLLAPVVGLDRPAVLAVLIAASSGAVALPIVQELQWSGRKALVTTAWIAIADVATVLALPIVLATGSLGRVMVGGVLVCLAASCLYLLARMLRHRRWVQRSRQLSHERGWGLDLRVSLIALFSCVWLASRYGTSILLAGFAVGAVVALLGEPRRVADQLVGLGEGFAIPVFFVHLGTQLDIGALIGSKRGLVLAGSVAVAAIGAHIAGSSLWRLPVSAGLLSSAQLGVPAAVVSIGLATDQISTIQGAALTAAMLITLAACSAGGIMLGHSGRLTDAAAPAPRQ